MRERRCSAGQSLKVGQPTGSCWRAGSPDRTFSSAAPPPMPWWSGQSTSASVTPYAAATAGRSARCRRGTRRPSCACGRPRGRASRCRTSSPCAGAPGAQLDLGEVRAARRLQRSTRRRRRASACRPRRTARGRRGRQQRRNVPAVRRLDPPLGVGDRGGRLVAVPAPCPPGSRLAAVEHVLAQLGRLKGTPPRRPGGAEL